MKNVEKLLQEDDFCTILEENALDTLSFLLDNGYEFGILCNLDVVEFQDELPEDSGGRLKPVTLFMIAGYTYDSAEITDDLILEFEAGFGSDGFGTIVQVPISGIVQIIVSDTPIFINLTATNQQKKEKKNKKGNEARSKNVFLNNPKNKNFFK